MRLARFGQRGSRLPIAAARCGSVVAVACARRYRAAMQRPEKLVTCLLIQALAFAGCSSRDADPPPDYSSGLNGDQGLHGLTPADKATLCTTQAAFVRTRVDTTALTRFWCAFTPAVFTAPNDAACQAAMDSCVQTFSIQLDVTVSDPNAPPPQCYAVDTSTCTGTVAQYEDCVNALANVQVQVGTEWSCGHRTEYPASPLVVVKACDALGPTCTAATGTPVIH